MKKRLPILFIFIFVSFFYLPILSAPNILTNRGNDLTEFFFPIFYFVRETIFKYHQLPFWNNLFFSGTPLLPDPQAPIFYLPNIIFLFLESIDTGFVVSIFLHIFIGGVGMYYLAKRGVGLSRSSSLFCSFLYTASPKLSGYIEAGHYSLITSWAWLPFAFLFTIFLAKKSTLKNTISLSLFLSLIFYCHVLIFGITIIFLCLLYFYLKKNPVPILISGAICFGFIAISLLPQLSWQSQTTRNLLLSGPDVYPKWLGFKEFIQASLLPIFMGPKFIWQLDTEKTISVGFFTLFFSSIGFLKTNKRTGMIVGIILLIILLVSLNNISPFYNFLIRQNWYILLRVSTRFWFLFVFISILLAGKGYEFISKRKNIRFLILVLAILSVVELLLTSWTKILKPIELNSNLAPKGIYEYLSSGKSMFRVFCLERCLSQKESAIYGLQLVEGYGTLQQMNYYIYSEQLSQAYYRNRYTLSIPPFEIFEYENLQPYSPNLSAYNIKYVISDHLLRDKNLGLVNRFGKYFVYLNEINLSRANYPITIYSPNFIRVDTSNKDGYSIKLSEVYNIDWKAYLNGKTQTKIFETDDKTREIKINKDTRFVDFIYKPTSFLKGLIITVITLELVFIISFKKFQSFFVKLIEKF